MTRTGNAKGRTLVLVRHADAITHNVSFADHERPLSEVGEQDAPRMARRLAERGIRPDRIVTSDAARALATAEEFRRALGLNAAAMFATRRIYEAGPQYILDLVRAPDGDPDCVMIIGHNPTLSQVANLLSTTPVGHLPTCSVVTLRLGSAEWRDAQAGAFELVDFDFPERRD